MTDKTPVVPVGAAPATAEHFRIASQKPAVKFLSRGVQPPSQIYVTNSDSLVASCATFLNPEVVTVSYRLLRYDGELVYGQFKALTTPNRVPVQTTEPLAEGFLLSVSCQAGFALTRGETFVRIFLTSQALGAGQPSYMLFSDYATTATAPAHPNGRVLSPVEGPGVLRIESVAAPGVAANWIVSQPTNTRWRVMGLSATFTTSAAVANRNIGITFGALGQTAAFGWADQTVPASSNPLIIGRVGFMPAPLNAFIVNVTIPQDLILRAGGFVQSSVFGMQAADQWGGPTLHIEEWIDNV